MTWVAIIIAVQTHMYVHTYIHACRQLRMCTATSAWDRPFSRRQQLAQLKVRSGKCGCAVKPRLLVKIEFLLVASDVRSVMFIPGRQEAYQVPRHLQWSCSIKHISCCYYCHCLHILQSIMLMSKRCVCVCVSACICFLGFNGVCEHVNMPIIS